MTTSKTTTTTTLAAGLLTTLGVIYYIRQQNNRNSNNSVKYPPKSKVGFFETIQRLGFRGGARDYLIEQFQSCGKVFQMSLYMPFVPMVVALSDTNDARAIYKDKTTTKPHALYHVMSRFTSGPNIVNIASNGQEWYHRRKGMNPSFAPKQVRSMNEKALKVAKEWESEVLLKPSTATTTTTTTTTIDVGVHMIDITVSVICLAAFDYKTTRAERRQLLSDMRCAWPEFTMRDSMLPLRQYLTFMIPERRRAFEAAKRLQQFAFRVMDNYRTNASPTPQTVVEMIVKNPNYKNDIARAADIVMVLFAGHDTTGYTLALAFLELAKHPEEQTKLRTELLQSKAKMSGVDQDESEKVSYLKAVVTETMRLYPVVSTPGIKMVGLDFITQDDKYFIPKGSVVWINQIGIARDPTIYDKPFDYNPSRWLDASDEMKQSLFPFSLGNRNCIGQPLANAELYTFLPYFIERYEFTVENEGQLTSPATLRLDNCRLKISKVTTS